MAQIGNCPTQLDEIDQWLFDSFGIVAGACSSTENLRHTTARMIAEALWPDKDYIADDSKKVGEDVEEAARNSWFNYEFDCGALYSKCYKDGFKAGANWQREQFHDACYQCEKAYDNVFYKGEKHAIKMMKKETISGEVVQNYGGKYALYIKAKLPKGTVLKFGDKVAVYIFKENTL